MRYRLPIVVTFNTHATEDKFEPDSIGVSCLPTFSITNTCTVNINGTPFSSTVSDMRDPAFVTNSGDVVSTFSPAGRPDTVNSFSLANGTDKNPLKDGYNMPYDSGSCYSSRGLFGNGYSISGWTWNKGTSGAAGTPATASFLLDYTEMLGAAPFSLDVKAQPFENVNTMVVDVTFNPQILKRMIKLALPKSVASVTSIEIQEN